MLGRSADPVLGPILWDLAHLAVYEDLWGVGAVLGPAARVTSDDFALLYDAFEQPRSGRPALTLLSLGDALDLQARVRARTLEGLERPCEEQDPRLRIGGFVYRMLVQHEVQHAETILQGLARLGMAPGGRRPTETAHPESVDHAARVAFERATVTIGRDVGGPYDNEFPAHAVTVEPFGLDRYPVSNRRFLEFVSEGGYRRRELWTASGWEWRQRTRVAAPLDWVEQGGGDWAVRRFGELRPLALHEPVQHVSAHEADAFARFAGGRLPREVEWERAAHARGPAAAAALDGQPPHSLGPPPLGPALLESTPLYPTQPAEGAALGGLYSGVYEWCACEFNGYPGFTAFPYREYSAVFFRRGYRVLRGCSWAAWPHFARPTYRNWDLPDRRQLFAGLRLAWDL